MTEAYYLRYLFSNSGKLSPAFRVWPPLFWYIPQLQIPCGLERLPSPLHYSLDHETPTLTMSTTHCAQGHTRNKDNTFWRFQAIFRVMEITGGTLPAHLLKRLGNKLFPFPSFLAGFLMSSQTLKDRFGRPWNLNMPVWSQEKQTTVC